MGLKPMGQLVIAEKDFDAFLANLSERRRDLCRGVDGGYFLEVVDGSVLGQWLSANDMEEFYRKMRPSKSRASRKVQTGKRKAG